MVFRKPQINVLVVDDSAFMRKAVSLMLESDPSIKVIDFARDGQEAVDKVACMKPDLVTMDIEMPRMDGLTALSKIMKETPTPVLMLSSITNEGARATMDAFDLGAVDFVPKQISQVSADIVKVRELLIDKVKQIHSRHRTLMAQYALGRRMSMQPGSSGVEKPLSQVPPESTNVRLRRRGVKVVAIGVSTGGPPALQKIIPKLPENFPSGILVVQHMPPKFTRSLADRLDSLSRMKVKEAENGEPIVSGCVYVAPGDKHLKVKKWGNNADIRLDDEPADTLHRPSVDVLMDSVADAFGKNSLGVILTGMGSDGLNGIRHMKGRGAAVIAQNEQTCVVYGMPKAVAENGLADKISPVDRIAHDIISYFT